MENKKYTYSEIFYSLQGEGKYTGIPTAWLRFFLCNLQCNGFGQKDPTDPSTYILPYKDLDISKIKTVEELPVFEYGCDSSYSWSKKYKHLMGSESAEVICEKLENTFKHISNPDGKYVHPKTKQITHLGLTGGEPMLQQDAIVDIVSTMSRRKNIPTMITVETNGTRHIKSNAFVDMVDNFKNSSEYGGLVDDSLGSTEWFWSVSPKLFNTSGEQPKKAIVPTAVKEYYNLSRTGQLKYVVNGTDKSWSEVEHATNLYRKEGVDWPVYIMPIGATKEQQESIQTARIAEEALKRGYYVSGRLHCYIWGNEIGR